MNVYRNPVPALRRFLLLLACAALFTARGSSAAGNLSRLGAVDPSSALRVSLVIRTNQPGWGSITPGYDGVLLQVGKKYVISAQAAPGFAFTNWYRLNIFTVTQTNYNALGQPIFPPTTSVIFSPVTLSNGPRLTFIAETPPQFAAGANPAIAEQAGYQANFLDVQRPALTIASPAANQIVATNAFLIRGRASDNAAVASVWYQLNGGAWQNPDGLTNWSAAVALNPGANVVQAYAVDSSGNLSSTSRASLVYNPVAPLLVQTNQPGWGAISPGYNGALLQIGKNYSMTARAAAGFAFANWSAVTPGSPFAALLTNQPTLQFTMSAGLGLQATFADVAPPTVTITAPTPNLRVTNTVYIAGGAGDNGAVAAVYYQLNGGGWQMAFTADQWIHWYSPGISLASGMNNVVQAYSVDTAGNISATQTVHFAGIYQDSAPDSLAGKFADGFAFPENELTNSLTTQGMEYVLALGTNTFSGSIFSPLPGPSTVAVSNNVGVFAYLKTSANQGILVLSNTAPPSVVDGIISLDLTFNSPGSATFYNEASGENGVIDFYAAVDVVPQTLAGKRLLLIDNDQGESTWALGKGVVAVTGFSGDRDDENYSFQPYSPTAGLFVMGTSSRGTNYVVLNFLSADSGTYNASSAEAGGNPSGPGTGEFVILSDPPVAPLSLAGETFEVYSNGNAISLASFVARTYSQYSLGESNQPHGLSADELGAYSYYRKNDETGLLRLMPAASPAVVAGAKSVNLTFLAPDFCLWASQDHPGVLETARVFALPRPLPANPILESEIILTQLLQPLMPAPGIPPPPIRPSGPAPLPIVPTPISPP